MDFIHLKFDGLGTGSGVLAVACAKAGVEKVVGTDINQRAEKFVKMNNQINGVEVEFVLTDLFEGIDEKFDKIVMDPPFMPSPKGNEYPTHAQSQNFGYENVFEPFFKQIFEYDEKKYS